MSIKRKVSIKTTIQQAMDNMGIEDTRDLPIFQVWAVDADRKIGSFYSYKKKIVVLDVKDCRVKLPCDAVAVLGLLLGDHGCDCGLFFTKAFSLFGAPFRGSMDSASGFLVIDALSSNISCTSVKWKIQDNCIVFSGNYNGNKVTIQYLGYQTDDEGWPMVNENHIDAISQYIEYKNALRHRWRPVEYQISENAILQMKREWGRKLRDARADDDEPSLSDKMKISAMINDPMSGIGIALWNYNDYFFLQR